MATPLHRPLLGLVALTLAAAPFLLSTSAQAADPVNTTTCNGKVVTQVVLASAGATATGTPGDDVIVVYVDRTSAVAVDALAGNDTVCIVGLTGFATVDAGDGDDVVSAAAVTEDLVGISANTVLLGAGNDTFVGGPDADHVQDTGTPASGDDVIETAGGFDQVSLRSGTDRVDLGAGSDSMDALGVVSGSWSGGVDTTSTTNLLILDSQAKATANDAPRADIDLDAGTFELGAATGQLTGFRYVAVRGYGTARVTGTDLPDRLEIRACRTVLDGGRGGDNVDLDTYRTCSSPSSRVHGGPGNDTIKASAGDDVLYGDGGRDRLYGRDGSDLLDGGGANDKLFGDPGRDILRGGGGKDTLTGDAGFDIAAGGNGRDRCVAERRISC